MEKISRKWGLDRAGLIALSVLAGNDYDTDGAKGVGAKGSLSLVRSVWENLDQTGALLPGEDKLGALVESVLSVPVDEELLRLSGCVVCKVCGVGGWCFEGVGVSNEKVCGGACE